MYCAARSTVSRKPSRVSSTPRPYRDDRRTWSPLDNEKCVTAGKQPTADDHRRISGLVDGRAIGLLSGCQAASSAPSGTGADAAIPAPDSVSAAGTDADST